MAGRQEAGSTACVVLASPDGFWAANAGDSRAVLVTAVGRVEQLTQDHKPDRPDELNRIMRGGGFVTFDGVHRVGGMLAVSRSLGDWSLRPHVVAGPEVTFCARKPADRWLVVASDGVWDVFDSAGLGAWLVEAEKAAARRGDTAAQRPGALARRLVLEARARGSGDNITVLLLDLGAAP